MSAPSPVVELEDRIGAQLLLAQLGAGAPPYLEPRYEIIELRGRGARGVVCRARDRSLARDVALKLYPPLPDAQLPQEVAREAQSLARLDHPNVVRVHDVGAAALVTGTDRIACLYLSMEFIEGRSLRAWRSERARPRNELLRVLLAAGEGLAAAHDGGLIHRDFKPENVMLDARGRVRIVDFGLARGIPTGWVWSAGVAMPGPQDSLVERLTMVGSVPGTLEYMAPEARQGYTDARSDQFSFAASVWESLTGELPFDVQWAMRQPPGTPLPLRGGAALPPRLRVVLERALSSAADQRWPDMHALLRALRRAATARRRIALSVLGLATAGSLGAGVVVGMQPRPEPAAALATGPSAPEQAKCRQAEGRWAFHTVVEWSEHDAFRWHGVNGYYELQLEPLDGCSMRMRVRKLGDSDAGGYSASRVREAEAAVVLSSSPDGLRAAADVDLASDTKARLRYRFELHLRGDALRGDWRQLDRQGRPVRKGGIVGGRTKPTTDVAPVIADLPCSSQCRVLCGSDRAAQRCIASTCASGEPPRLRGCAPADDFVIPAIAQENLYALSVEPDYEGATRCPRAALALAGTWRVWARGTEDPWSLTITESPRLGQCSLQARLTHPRGEERRLQALVDQRGGWALAEPNPFGESVVVWSLVGWNPAYGTTSDGIALSAHRLDPAPRTLPQDP